MTVETVEDLAETLADWMGVFGCCKNVKTNDDLCTFDPEKPTCCRVGLVQHLKERIVQAVENERRLAELFGDNFREVLTQKT